MGCWTHIHLEAYCTFAYASKKKWNTVEWKTNKKHVLENKGYIPKNKRPDWCRKNNKDRIPHYKCLASKCPFLAYCRAIKEDYLLFDKAYNEKYNKNKHL